MAAAASFCGECGAALATRPEPTARSDGERRHVTVLFADLVGSTELSTRLDPEEWSDLVAQYLEAMASVIGRFGGHVVRYMGDGVLALFGYPRAHGDDAERAVRAGLAMLDEMRATGTLEALSVRVGIHAGLTVVTDAGDGPDVFGETPNVAARVQAAATPNSVFVSSAVQRLVAGLFIVEDRGPHELRGVPYPVTLYRVVQPSGGVRSRLAFERRRTRFVGRERELARLTRAWEDVVAGTGRTIFLVGEAGIGKSRLCAQLRDELGGEPHTWIECHCSPFTAGTAFWPVIELAAQALGFLPTDEPADKLEKLRLGLERAGFTGDEPALLAEWLELPESAGYRRLPLASDVKRQRTLDTLAAWNRRMSEMQPILLLVEDLQWCDPSSLELLGRLIAQSETTRLLLLCTARPEFTPSWPARATFTTVTLGRLTKEQTLTLVRDAMPRDLDARLVDAVVERADGVPLFAEELVQAVAEADHAEAEGHIPATLQDSLMARLDRLPSGKRVAQTACVLGREFSYRLLEAIGDIDEVELRRGLAELVDAELVFVRGDASDATYTFKHALVQEVAYGSLLRRTRQRLHGRVADVLLAERAAGRQAEAEVLARHAEAAGRLDEAAAAYQEAGDAAQSASAHQEAIRHFRQAIALLRKREEEGAGDLRREAALHVSLGASLIASAGFAHPEVERAFERARALYEQVDDLRGIGFALGGLSVFQHNAGCLAEADALATRLDELARETGETDLQLLADRALGVIQYYQGRFASSLQRNERILALYQMGRHHPMVAMAGDPRTAALAVTSLNLLALGFLDRGAAKAEEAIALARRLGSPFSLAHAVFYACCAYTKLRDRRAQRACAAETIAIADAEGFPSWSILARTWDAAARLATGERDAYGELQACVGLIGKASRRGVAPPPVQWLVAEACLEVGLDDDAITAAERGLQDAAARGQRHFDADLHRIIGEVLFARGEHDAAETRFQQALVVAREQGAKLFELRAATALARLRLAQSRASEARAVLEPVYGWFREGFDFDDLRTAGQILAQTTHASTMNAAPH